jgi:hypothetical protein
MKKVIFRIVANASLIVLSALWAPAYALSPVTFVSPNGSDGNNCETLATACRELGGITGALSKTESRGTIHVLPGSYQAFNVSGSYYIYADEGQASIDKTSVETLGLGAASIGINTASGAVRIRGFTLNSLGNGIGIYSNSSNGSGVVHLENCTFETVAGPGNAGVEYAPNGASELYITDSTFHGPGIAVFINPKAGGSARVHLDRLNVEDASGGVFVDGRFTAGANRVVIRDTVISGGGTGIAILEDQTGTTNVVVEESSLDSNGTALSASGAPTTVRMVNTRVMLNTVGLLAGSGGKIISNGGNVVRGNTTNGAFTATEAQP